MAFSLNFDGQVYTLHLDIAIGDMLLIVALSCMFPQKRVPVHQFNGPGTNCSLVNLQPTDGDELNCF